MTNKHKILSLSELSQKVQNRGNKKVVLCHGVFDLLHIGHIRYFEQASKKGDILVVTVTPDRFVDKGPGRPAFNEEIRAEAVASLNIVQYVAINEWETAEELLKLLKPDFYAKGSEFKDQKADRVGKIGREIKILKEFGGEMVFTDDSVFSSSNLINRFFSRLPEEQREYMCLFRGRYSLNDFTQSLDAMKNLKVLVIGDTILDEYQYGNAIGKSSKDPILAIKHTSTELYAGGVLAVANHLAEFVSNVDLVTVLGEKDSQKEFVLSSLKKNVSPVFFKQKNAPTIVKRRIIDSYSLNKLIEVYMMDDSGLDTDEDSRLREYLGNIFDLYDLVLVTDYGHGAISKKTAVFISENAPYLAINTQHNAGNRGFHTITRYPKADLVSLAEHEIRLEFRKPQGGLRNQMKKLGESLNLRFLIVTNGRKGCTVWDNDGGFVAVPSVAERIVDRVGAGDAFLSLVALASLTGIHPEMMGFIGNVAGSLAVGIVGNEKSIDKTTVEKYLTALMK